MDSPIGSSKKGWKQRLKKFFGRTANSRSRSSSSSATTINSHHSFGTLPSPTTPCTTPPPQQLHFPKRIQEARHRPSKLRMRESEESGEESEEVCGIPHLAVQSKDSSSSKVETNFRVEIGADEVQSSESEEEEEYFDNRNREKVHQMHIRRPRTSSWTTSRPRTASLTKPSNFMFSNMSSLDSTPSFLNPSSSHTNTSRRRPPKSPSSNYSRKTNTISKDRPTSSHSIFPDNMRRAPSSTNQRPRPLSGSFAMTTGRSIMDYVFHQEEGENVDIQDAFNPIGRSTIGLPTAFEVNDIKSVPVLDAVDGNITRVPKLRRRGNVTNLSKMFERDQEEIKEIKKRRRVSYFT